MPPAVETATLRWRDKRVHPNAPVTDHVVLPDYLEKHYAWAYLDPRNARIFDHPAFLQLLLFGHYRTLGNAAMRALDITPRASLLQVGCVYGDLTPRLARRVADGHLAVLDAAPLQLDRLRQKLPASRRVQLYRQDATAMRLPTGSVDRVLLFFLLHELPAVDQRRALDEALRVCRPGGRVVIVDYRRPHALHPLRWLLQPVLSGFEPFAERFWSGEISALLPARFRGHLEVERRWLGGLYRMVTLVP